MQSQPEVALAKDCRCGGLLNPRCMRQEVQATNKSMDNSVRTSTLALLSVFYAAICYDRWPSFLR